MDKSILDELQHRSFTMIDAYRSFTEYMLALKDRNYDEDVEDEDMALEDNDNLRDSSDDEDGLLMAMSDYEDDYEDSEDSEELDYECEDFPGRDSFTLSDISDADSERFYTGSSLGIPKAVAVRQNNKQGKLLPIRNGLFYSEEY